VERITLRFDPGGRFFGSHNQLFVEAKQSPATRVCGR
jgi:hypothetical protein